MLRPNGYWMLRESCTILADTIYGYIKLRQVHIQLNTWSSKHLRIIFFQQWQSNMENSSKSKHYGYIKDSMELEKYFKCLPKHLYLNMIHFRAANHKLPIEEGRWNNIDLEDWKYNLCDRNTIDDEFHYLLECSLLKMTEKKLSFQSIIVDQIW